MINTDTYTGPSFSVKNRIGRVLWNVVNVLFFQYSPKPFFSWRSFLLRSFGAEVGKGVHIYPKVKIWAPWNLVLGAQCGVANGVILYSQGKITIGKKAVISQGAHICAGTHDYTRKGFPLITMPIIIGDDVWVAADAFIHPGIIVGDGCVIGARAVVNKDMPPWMVCAGHPCKPIKKRIIADN
jgi:putative colanic acid biosynthesis acetyltransferase WcaF